MGAYIYIHMYILMNAKIDLDIINVPSPKSKADI